MNGFICDEIAATIAVFQLFANDELLVDTVAAVGRRVLKHFLPVTR